MKKVLLVLFLYFLYVQPVSAVFQLSIQGGAPVNLGNVYAGEDAFPKGVEVSLECSTDQPNPWELQVYAGGDLLDNASGYTMPVEQLKWYGTYAGGPLPAAPFWEARTYNFVKGYGGKSIPLTIAPDSIYSSDGTNDYIGTQGTQVKIGFGIVVPDTQPPGNYATAVRFIMTE